MLQQQPASSVWSVSRAAVATDSRYHCGPLVRIALVVLVAAAPPPPLVNWTYNGPHIVIVDRVRLKVEKSVGKPGILSMVIRGMGGGVKDH